MHDYLLKQLDEIWKEAGISEFEIRRRQKAIRIALRDEALGPDCDMDGYDDLPNGDEHYWHCNNKAVITCHKCNLKLCPEHLETHEEYNE